jgi:hypothetical protein
MSSPVPLPPSPNRASAQMLLWWNSVLRRAAEILSRVAEALGDGWSFIHRRVFGHRIAKWIASKVGWGLIGAGVAVAQWDEYAVALVLFISGCTILLLRAYHWRGIEGWVRASAALRLLLIALAAVGMVASYPITSEKRGDKPWSSGVHNFVREKWPLPPPPAAPNPPRPPQFAFRPSSEGKATASERPAEPAAKGPRLGTGPEAYKDLTDEQVGQWAIEEVEKIEEMAERCIQESIGEMKQGRSGKAPVFFFTIGFNRCCAQDLKNLRAEVLARLGPPAKDPEEESAWLALFPDVEFPVAGTANTVNPMSVEIYAPYLRRLGLRVRRRTVPRAAPIALPFSEEQLPSGDTMFPYRIVVTVKTKTPVSAGYIIVQFAPPFSGVVGMSWDGYSGRGSVLDSRMIDNTELLDFLKEHPKGTCALVVGKTPFVPANPLRLRAFGEKPLHVARVILFDE